MSIFDSVFIKKPGRSLFNLSHERKMTCNFGYLYPFLCMECVPGDTFKVATELLVRSAPLKAPVMHRVNVKLNYFFVPNRLLWNEWEDFITGVDQSKNYVDAAASYFVQPVPPYCEITSTNEVDAAGNHLLQDGSLADFLGFPTHRPSATVGGTVKVPLLPFYAYNKIYVDWYRNQNVEGGHVGPHASGVNNTNGPAYMVLRHRMWEKDYFTSALPFAQRGDAMPIPIQEDAIIFDNNSLGTNVVKASDGVQPANANLSSFNGHLQVSGTNVNIDNSSSLKIDTNALGTINDLRVATRIQRWLEKNARVGGRYIEQILAHFGVHSSDARLQRAEYLGGYTLPIIISDVEQTSATVGGDFSGTDTPQGTLAGKSTGYGKSKPVKCFCEEYGFLFGIMTIIPRTTYQDGLSRMWTREVNYDYYFPEFANLGEQEVKKSEVWYDVTTAANRTAAAARFGYQERYCEYKYQPSSVHGEFKNNLQFWHLGRSFTSVPALNHSFVKCAPSNRIFAVTDTNLADNFYVSLYNDVSALRPMPKHAIPTL